MKERKRSRISGRRAWLLWLVSLLFAIGLLLPGGPVGADDPTPAPGEPAERKITTVGTLADAQEIERPSRSNPKLGSSLNQLLEAYRREGLTEAQAFATTHMMVLDDDRVQVVIATTQEAISDLKEAVEALGGEYQGHYETLLQALVPINALESLAGRPDVQVVREPRRLIPLGPKMAGTVDTEGLGPSNASAWHSVGHTGSGARVAVIDGGFTDYTSLLGTDLPGSVTTYDWTGTGMGGSEHGTACAEVVYDMAYGATMDLHKVSTPVDLSNAVSQAIADGVDIISMSGGWTIDGPGDGTGNLANIVNNARSNGIFFAVAAGNNAQVNWAGTYVNYNTGTHNYHAWDGASLWYNFLGAGDGTCYVYTAGTPIRAGLHWDDWTNVNQNYDLHLYRWPGGSTIYRVASSTNPQNGGGGQTPEEYVSYTAAGGNCYAWVVERVSATRNVCLRLSAPKMVHLDEWTPERSLSFPADSPDAITVGAVDVSSPYPLESYSSRGPTFGPGGTCSGGSTKPDIAAYANVSTVSYGSEAFNGTSAATPHVAGAAALVRGACPSYGVSQLQSFLEGRAIDLGTPGKDNLYGSGRLYLGDDVPCGNVGPVGYDSRMVDDDNSGQSSGNDDGIIDPGETIELYVTLHNQGSGTATGVNATVSTSDPYVTFTHNTSSSYPDIPGGGTGTNSSDFDFEVDPSTPDGHGIHFDLDITSSNGGPWSDSFGVTVGGGGKTYLPIVLKNYSPTAPSSWVIISSVDFEGTFPGSWDVFDNNGSSYGEYYWNKRSCRPYAGSYSGWAVGGGANGAALSCGSNYPNYAVSWMVYGPFSLAGATASDLQFKLWLNTELNWDSVCRAASIDSIDFYGSCTSGNSGGWIDRVLDLSNVPTLGNLLGRSNVWIALIFGSDGSITYPEGAYVDNIVLRKCTVPGGCAGGSSAVPASEQGQTIEVPAAIKLQK